MQLCDSLSILWHCLSLELEWKLTFSNPVATAQFSKFAGIWNAALSQHHLSGLSPPLALFIVMFPKAHLTLHSRMSGSRWVIIPAWLSRSLRPFFYSSSVHSCHLLFALSYQYDISYLYRLCKEKYFLLLILTLLCLLVNRLAQCNTLGLILLLLILR